MHALPGERRRWALAGAGLVAVLVTLAAILGWWPFGGTLTRAELIAEGDEICARAHDAFRELQSEPPRTAREAAELTDKLVGIAEDELDEIDGLRAPSSLDDQVERYLDARRDGIDLLREGLAAAEESEPRPYEAAQAKLAAGQRDPRRALAREIGFAECSKPLVGRAELRRQAQRPTGGDPDAPPVVSNR